MILAGGIGFDRRGFLVLTHPRLGHAREAKEWQKTATRLAPGKSRSFSSSSRLNSL